MTNMELIHDLSRFPGDSEVGVEILDDDRALWSLKLDVQTAGETCERAGVKPKVRIYAQRHDRYDDLLKPEDDE